MDFISGTWKLLQMDQNSSLLLLPNLIYQALFDAAATASSMFINKT